MIARIPAQKRSEIQCPQKVKIYFIFSDQILHVSSKQGVIDLVWLSRATTVSFASIVHCKPGDMFKLLKVCDTCKSYACVSHKILFYLLIYFIWLPVSKNSLSSELYELICQTRTNFEKQPLFL